MMIHYVTAVFLVCQSVAGLPLELVFSQWDSTIGRCPSLYGTSEKPGLLGTFDKLKSTCSRKTGPLCAGVLGISIGVCEIHQQKHNGDIQTDMIRLPELPETAGPEEICTAMVEPHLQKRLKYHITSNVIYKTFKSKLSGYLAVNNTKSECVEKCSEPEVEGMDPDNFQEEDRIYLCKTAVRGLQSLAAILGPTPEEERSMALSNGGAIPAPKQEGNQEDTDKAEDTLNPDQVKKSIEKSMKNPSVSAFLNKNPALAKVGNSVLKLVQEENDLVQDGEAKDAAQNKAAAGESVKDERAAQAESPVNHEAAAEEPAAESKDSPADQVLENSDIGGNGKPKDDIGMEDEKMGAVDPEPKEAVMNGMELKAPAVNETVGKDAESAVEEHAVPDGAEKPQTGEEAAKDEQPGDAQKKKDEQAADIEKTVEDDQPAEKKHGEESADVPKIEVGEESVDGKKEVEAAPKGGDNNSADVRNIEVGEDSADGKKEGEAALKGGDNPAAANKTEIAQESSNKTVTDKPAPSLNPAIPTAGIAKPTTKGITPEAKSVDDENVKVLPPPDVDENEKKDEVEEVKVETEVVEPTTVSGLDEDLKESALIPGDEEDEKLEEEKEENADEEEEKQLENQEYEDRNMVGDFPQKTEQEARYKSQSSPTHYYEENMEESNFMTMLLTFVALTLLGYLAFHNKHRIIAVMIEGRRRRPAPRGRFANTSYKKLDSNFDDTLSSTGRINRSDVIY